MTKLGVLVGESKWKFFDEIFDDLAAHYDTDVYERKTFNLPIPVLGSRLNRWAFQEGLRSIMRRNDVCFFEWASELLMHASHMPKYSSIITRLHSFELYSWAPKINWRAVDKVILVSQAMRQRFIELYPEHSHKTAVVYNGKSIDESEPVTNRPFEFKLGMLSSKIVPIKRVYELVLTIYDLKLQGYDATLHIAGRPAGDTRYAASIHRLVEKLNLQEAVIFHGFVQDVSTWLHGIDIFVSNSFWEGHQVALIEAMAASCYCLSHSWYGAEEILPQENLYITEGELQRKIIEYNDMPENERLQHQARLRSIACSSFDIERTRAQIRGIVEEEVRNSIASRNGSR